MDTKGILEWFAYADKDIAVAEHLFEYMHPKPLEVICYHCQQSAEKYLKAYLGYIGADEPPRTHDLDRLCSVCAKNDQTFSVILDECLILLRYGVQPRYPNELYIDEPLTQKALRCARQIKAFAPLLAARKQLEEPEEPEEI